MHLMHVALGGCLTAPPVAYGLTEDTGGHIAYVLGAAAAQATRGAGRIDIVTRAFHDPALGAIHAQPVQRIDPVTRIIRLSTAETRYLCKDALEAELPALTDAFLRMLGHGPKPDAIHAHFADATELALAARARFGIPVVYTPHSLGIDKAGCMGDDPGLARRIARERAAIAGADAIVVSSRNEAERQVEAYGARATGRVHRINPGVTLPPAPEGRDRAAAILSGLDDPSKPLILAVARPVAKKNLPALLDAFAATPGLSDRANLCILAGQHDRLDGPATEQGRQLALLHAGLSRHGLEGRAVLPPCHDGADVTHLYRHAAATGGVFVNPALHEPFGLTLIEAAAAGLPVVATCHGGPADIVAQVGHGTCVDPRDGAALGHAISDLLADRDRWQACADAARANLGPFGWDGYARQSLRLYEALSRPAAPALRRAPTRLLVCDIDGTLTGSRPAARRFARWARTRTLPFAVATGRSMSEARRVLAEWELPDPDLFVTSVGSEIYLPDAHGRAAPDDGFEVRIADGWDADAVSAALLAAGATPQDPVEQRIFKRSFLGDAAEADRLRETLQAAGLAATVIQSHARLIDVLPARAGKAAAMTHAAARMGLAPADCIACGDSGNDASMLRAAGAAVIVGNALPEIASLRARPGLVRARAHHADGVLEGLSRLGLNADVRAPERVRA